MPIVIATLLTALSAPLVKRILIALGFGLITYAGFTTIKGQLDSQIISYMGNMAASIYQLLGLIGFVDAIGIWMGALTACVSVLTAKRLALI